jgi:hypothetical protein
MSMASSDFNRVRWIVLAGPLCAAALLGLVFVYFADFSWRQSIVLSIVLTIPLAYLKRRIQKCKLKSGWRFTPYYVWVWPKWGELLTDFKLVGGPDEWQAIQSSLKNVPPTEYRALRSGTYFTVVHESEDFNRTLVYWNNCQKFFSTVNFGDSIEPMKTKYGEVEVFVRFVGDRYDLGICVPTDWWDEVKMVSAKPMREDQNFGRGRTELILTTVSNREFDSYRVPMWAWDNAREFLAWQKRVDADKKERQREAGWNKIEQAFAPEVGSHIDLPEFIEHKYFVIEHRAV